MSIIVDTSINISTLEGSITRSKQMNFQLYKLIESLHTQSFNFIWKNPKFTPKQIIEGYGTDAAALFKNSSDIQTILATTNPAYQPLSIPAGYTVTFNEDGSAIVTKA